MKILSMSRPVSDILRRVKNLKKAKTKISKAIKNIFNKKNIATITKKISSLSLIFKVVAFSLVMVSVPAGAVQMSSKDKNNIAPYDTSIKLDTGKNTAIVLPEQSKPEIKIGESEFNKKEREAREAAEKELAASSRTVVTRESTSNRTSDNDYSYDPDLATKRALAKKAAAQYGIDWRVLEAVWQVESGKAWITPVKSYAGAQGPMQFMSGTWNKYAVDGNGDGSADINNAEDAVYAGANLLAQAGAASGDVNSALLSYNHAQWYVDKVLNVANSITD